MSTSLPFEADDAPFSQLQVRNSFRLERQLIHTDEVERGAVAPAKFLSNPRPEAVPSSAVDEHWGDCARVVYQMRVEEIFGSVSQRSLDFFEQQLETA